MDLEPFGNAVGISDILQFRACKERFVWGMRRHVELPERMQLYPGEKDVPPESTNWTNAYGSAIHEAIHLVETGATHDEAVAKALEMYGTYLTPSDIALLKEDLDLYEFRHPKDMELVAAERDLKVPLFVTDDGVQIYFRFKLDVLFRSREHRDVFMLRDYKSSAHRKTAAEVHADPQQWAYNFAVHELWPECRLLLQEYDQLKFGVERTTKNAQQREEMRQWLIAQVKMILAEKVFAPSINDFCGWCPLVTTCRETRRASSAWRGKLAVTAPLRKDGHKMKVEFFDDQEEIERIIRDDLPKMQQVRKHIEKVEKELKTIIEQMTVEDRARLGWRLSERHSKSIDAQGLRELHNLLGDVFYDLVKLPMSALEDLVGKPKKGEPIPPELKIMERWSMDEVSSVSLAPVRPAISRENT